MDLKKLMRITHYAKMQKCTRKTVYKWVKQHFKEGKDYISIDGVVFINLNAKTLGKFPK